MKILVAGCGGVGSEVIKLVRNHELTLIDHDRIEVTNLNRQFFFSPSDCGRYKAEVIGEKLRCKYLVGRIEEVSVEAMSGFDAVICCVDSIESRMALNTLFKKSRCDTLVDCGVENNRLHVKKVTRQSSCLYCIRNIYSMAPDIYYCSLASVPRRVEAGNRERVLASIITRETEKDSGDRGKEGNITDDCDGKDEIVDRCVAAFNEIAPKELMTDSFEVRGYVYRIVPSICYANSICASYAVLILLGIVSEDFIFYDGARKDELATRLVIEPNEDCLVCEKTRKKESYDDWAETKSKKI